MTQDEIIEMAKERLVRIMGTFDLATGHADTFDELLDSLQSELRDVLGHYREALAQTQEPVAWIHNFIEGGISIGKQPADLNRHPDRWTALYKDPTPCQTCQALARTVMFDQTSHDTTPLERTWVGLTDKDISEIVRGTHNTGSFVRAIEAKLKKKNGYAEEKNT